MRPHNNINMLLYKAKQLIKQIFFYFFNLFSEKCLLEEPSTLPHALAACYQKDQSGKGISVVKRGLKMQFPLRGLRGKGFCFILYLKEKKALGPCFI